MRALRLKVCGMREEANIADVGSLCPDYLGFIFVPSSPRYVGDALRPERISLPSVTQRIGVFKDAPLPDVVKHASAFNLHGVQLHGSETHEYMRALRNELPSTLIIKAINVQTPDDISALAVDAGLPDLFLLDSKSPGSGIRFEWDLLTHYQAPADFMLAGGLDVDDIPTIITLAKRFPRMVGIDINSKVESAPGCKDVQKIKEVLRRLEYET